ncbi:MAG: phosphohistidine phosphatase SixA [Vicinamibacterales bacterium]
MAAAREVYLVRHAIAAARGAKYPDDRRRPLTAAGMSRFRRAVAGLAALGVELDLVLTSPLARATGTAEILAAGLSQAPPVEVLDLLAPGTAPRAVAEAVSGLPASARRVALVGHEPDLGHLAARLLGARGAVEFKKGAVALIELDGALPGGPGTLRFLLPPRMLRRLAR